MKQTAVEWLVEQICGEHTSVKMKQTAMQEHIEWLKATIEIAEEQSPILVNALKLCLIDATQRLAMEKDQSHKYAEFAIRCDRKDMKILNFEDWIKLETFKSE